MSIMKPWPSGVSFKYLSCPDEPGGSKCIFQQRRGKVDECISVRKGASGVPGIAAAHQMKPTCLRCAALTLAKRFQTAFRLDKEILD